VHTNMATVTEHAGWTSQTGTVGRRESNGRFKQAICTSGYAEFDTAGLAGSMGVARIFDWGVLCKMLWQGRLSPLCQCSMPWGPHRWGPKRTEFFSHK